MFVSTSFDFIVNEETFVYFKLLDTLNWKGVKLWV
jgi:hypothetical protein